MDSEKKRAKKKTFGATVIELQEKKANDKNPMSINELTQNILYGMADSTSEGSAKSYLQRVWDAAQETFQQHRIEVCFVETRYKSTGKFGNNTTDKVYIGRQTCPTPTYAQDAFRVHTNGSIEYLWSIPSKFDVHIIMTERMKLALDPEYSELVKMVIDFADGTLYRMAMSFDKEYEESIKGNA